MSLLLDALKRAEQAKRGSPAPSAPSESAAANTEQSAALPGVTPGPSLGAARRAAELEAARTLFASKQQTVQNRPMWLLLGGVALLAISGGIFWLWYALTYPATPQALLASPPPPRPPTKSATTTPPTPPVMSVPEPPAPAKTETATAANKSSAPVHRPRTDVSPPAQRAVPELKRSNPPPERVSPELAAGYGALTHGDYLTAERQYRLALASDPASLDAYLGLATAAASSGNFAAAQAYYRKALEMDPKNAVAGAALATLGGNSDAAETRLKAQIAATPGAAPPYSALGHIYVAQSRWNDAQQAFFEAYRLDPANPDYAFNLAVSLDHLKQDKLANEYYSRALTLSESRPAAFSSAEANARIKQLDSVRP